MKLCNLVYSIFSRKILLGWLDVYTRQVMSMKNNMKVFFLLSTMISTVTSFVLFALLYSTSRHYASIMCVNYSPPQLLSSNSRQRSFDGFNFSFRGSVRNETVPVASSERNASSSVTPDVATVASFVDVTLVDERNITVSKPKVDFRSWHGSVLTEIRPTLRQNCTRLRLGDEEELERTQDLLQRMQFSVAENLTTCKQIRSEFYDNYYVSETEKKFPLAFALVVHTNAEQILRFLKVIYRPQNVYCFHPDPRNQDVFQTFRKLASCLPNVRIASRLHHVKYYRPSTIFRAQMSCYRDLYEMKTSTPQRWKYVINLCGREIPLKTNRRIVEDLMKLKGRNVIRPHPIDRFTLDSCFLNVRNRISREHSACASSAAGGRDVNHVSIATVERCDPFLKNNSLRLYKSMTYNAYSRDFVHYFLHNTRVRTLQEWMLKNCRTPEEHFYAMASMIPGAPGAINSFLNSSKFEIEEPEVFKAIWYHDKSSPHREANETCAGRVVHSVCIANAAELPRVYDVMTQTNAWFFNKYFMEEDHIVMDCVEPEIGKMNQLEYEKDQKT